MISNKAALAATLGLTLSELSEYRYQPTRARMPIYTFGGYYWATGQRVPKYGTDEGLTWEQHPDKFWGEQAHTIIWRANETAREDNEFNWQGK